MSICPHCGGHTPTPRHSEKLRSLFAARVGMPAKVNRRSPDAAHNEMATDIAAAGGFEGQRVVIPGKPRFDPQGNRFPPLGGHATDPEDDIAAAEASVMWSMCVPADVLTSRDTHATATEHAIRAAIDGDARAIRTVVRHAEDCIDPSRACPEPRRALGFIEVKPGEETERFDEFTGPMGGEA